MPKPTARQRTKRIRSMELNDDQWERVNRARALLRLPYLHASGNPWKPKPQMPTVKSLELQFSRQLRALDLEDPSLSADARKKLIKKRDEFEALLGLFRSVKTWSKDKWMDYRAQFLCDGRLDLDTAMMLRGQKDALAVTAIEEKAGKQITNLRLLAEHSSTTNRAAVDALLKIAKDAVEALNHIAVVMKIPAALRAAQESETWPVLAADHPAHKEKVKAVLQKLDVGSRYRIRIEKKARAKLGDPAGRLTAVIIEKLTAWRNTYRVLRDQDWFWEKVPDWAKQIIDLPDYDKERCPDWWKSAEAMLEFSYGGRGRVSKDYLGRILKDKSGKPLSFRRVKMAIKSRFNGQAPT